MASAWFRTDTATTQEEEGEAKGESGGVLLFVVQLTSCLSFPKTSPLDCSCTVVL